MHKETNKPTGLAAEIGMLRPFRYAEEEAFLNILRTYSLFASSSEKLFKEHGISGPQYNVLRILRGHGNPVSVYQLAAEMVTPNPDMPRLVNRLQAVELVTKKRCKNDRRVVWVHLTKSGSVLLRKLDRPLAALHQTLLGHLSQENLKTLNNLLFRARHPDSS